MASISLDEQTSATLTDAELEAIKDDGYSEDERQALASIAGDTEGEDDGPEDDDDEDEDDDETEDETGEDAAPPQEFRPSYQAALPENFDATLAAINAEASRLATQFRDGEIDFDDYTAAVNEVNAHRDALTATKIKAEIAAEMQAQDSQQRWRWTVEQFIARTAADEKIDYRTDAAKLKDFDLFVKALASDDANASRPAEWFLAEAHKRVKALHGVATTAPSADTRQQITKPASRKPDLKAVPKTLAHVPGSDGSGDVESEFADVYRLEGLEFETAIARMSPAQREKFARAG